MRRDYERKRFLKRLENERPQPPDEFVSAVADQLESNRARRARGWQVAFAGGLTTLLVLAFAMTGGIGYAASAVKDGTTAVTTLVVGSSKADKADKPQNASQVNSGAQNSANNASSSNANSAAKGNQQSSARNQYQEKVVICHRPPGNPDNAHTISVSPNAVPAHLAHGDTLGPCPNGR
jgi:predicted lipid-binding transport protein (Tim44 family)